MGENGKLKDEPKTLNIQVGVLREGEGKVGKKMTKEGRQFLRIEERDF